MRVYSLMRREGSFKPCVGETAEYTPPHIVIQGGHHMG